MSVNLQIPCQLGIQARTLENEERKRDFMSEIGYKMFISEQVEKIGDRPRLSLDAEGRFVLEKFVLGCKHNPVKPVPPGGTKPCVI